MIAPNPQFRLILIAALLFTAGACVWLVVGKCANTASFNTFDAAEPVPRDLMQRVMVAPAAQLRVCLLSVLKQAGDSNLIRLVESLLNSAVSDVDLSPPGQPREQPHHRHPTHKPSERKPRQQPVEPQSTDRKPRHEPRQPGEPGEPAATQKPERRRRDRRHGGSRQREQTRTTSAPAEPGATSKSTTKYHSYYASIDMNGRAEALREQLTELLSNHKALDYSELWKAFEEIDSSHPTGNGMCKNHQINDIYSDKCWRFKKDQCGKFSEEGDCFNREHSWPKSWWGGDDNNAYSDLFHLFPSDGYNNNIRSNNPLGRVDRSDVLYKTNSGCLSGACADLPGSTCWEPADKWKGVLARAYLYMSVAYRNTFQCCDKEQVNGAQLKPWALKTILSWHTKFPPTAYERHRNDVIFNSFQHNRNPFIDHPELAQRIFNA